MPNQTPSEQQIAQIRARIDDIDLTLVKLLVERAALTHQIGQNKRKNGEAVWVPQREEQVLARVTKLPHGHLSKRGIRAVFREVLSAGRETQGGLRVLVQDLESAAASKAYFGECTEIIIEPSVVLNSQALIKAQAQLVVTPSDRETYELSTLKKFEFSPAENLAAKEFSICAVSTV